MAMPACPRCHLPREADAWQCDGCGLAFRDDYDQVRSELRAKLSRTRVALGLSVVLGCALAVGVAFMALHGMIYISVTLAVAVVGSIGHSAHRISVLREHLQSLDRRHVPLPKATAHLGPGPD